MVTSKFLTLAVGVSLLAACVGGCSKESTPSANSSASSKPTSSAAPKSTAAPAQAPPIALTMQDITAHVDDALPGMKGGKVEMKLPKGTSFKKGPGTFVAQLDPKVFAVEVGSIHKSAKVIAKIESGKSLIKGAKIVEKGDGYVIQHGKYFGSEGHSLNFDLPPIGSLVAGCRTPTGRLYSLKQVHIALEACRSFKFSK